MTSNIRLKDREIKKGKGGKGKGGNVKFKVPCLICLEILDLILLIAGSAVFHRSIRSCFLNKVEKIRGNVPVSNGCPFQGIKKKTAHQKYYFSLSTVSEEKIVSVIRNLKNSAATGVDDIPTHLLKLGAKIIAVPLTWIINTSITSGKFPSLWKKAKVIPLHKKNDINTISNYRPVSNLCISSKVLEKVIHLFEIVV